MAGPRFSHAEPSPDGGTNLYTPDGKKVTLHGQSVAQYGATLPPPAFVQSEGLVPGTEALMTPQAAGIRPLQPLRGFQPPQTQEEKDRAWAVEAQRATAELDAQNDATLASVNADRAKRGEAPFVRGNDGKVAEGKPDKAGAGGPAIGMADVTGPAPPPASEAEAKQRGYSSLDEARLAFKAALDAEMRQGGGAPTKAHWQNTSRSTVRDGVESAETAAARQAALGQLGEAQGLQAENARGQDMADEAAMREAARHSQGTQTRLDTAAGIEERALLDREARLRAEANESPLGFSGSSVLGKINKALTRANETQGSMEGDAIIMSANGGGSVGSIMAAKQAAKEARLGRQDRQNDEADKARAGVGQLRANIEKIKSAEYADYLANTLKANAAQYKASGRLGELQASLAALEEKKAALRGDREAKQQGTSTTGEKFVPASSGGGANRAAALAKYGERMLHVGQLETSQDANEARLAAASAKNKAPTIVIGGQRVPVDTNLPDSTRGDLYKQAGAQDQAEAALGRIQARLDKMGARRFAPGAIGELLQGADGAALRADVQAITRNESVAEGGGALQETERRAAEEQFLGALSSKGTIEAKAAKYRDNKKRLLRQATGQD